MFEQRALAAAGPSEDDANLARVDREIDAIEDRAASVTRNEAVDLERKEAFCFLGRIDHEVDEVMKFYNTM